MAHLDPIAAKLNQDRERRFINEYLNSIQQKKLVIARDYAREVKVTMWEWWQRAGAEGASPTSAVCRPAEDFV